ncbi:hypothetical protein HIM_01801 [Hirsutella minnesotensis 3608]|nr:hypothetical protein HIM_01801 [Hirsutella minnesotensis 3608]
MAAETGFSSKLLAGKVGVVTGAGSPKGIGRSLVRALAAAGARAVYAVDLKVTEITSLRGQVLESGSSCEIHPEVLDVSSEEQTIRLMKQVLDRYGRLDFYFANAGVVSFRPLDKIDASLYDRIISINQKASFLAVRYAGQAMAATSPDKPKPGGSIVLVSSIAGINGSMADVAYGSSKAAISHIAQCASVQLAATHVRVNAVAPGVVKTSLLTSSTEILNTGSDENAASLENAAKVMASGPGEEPLHYFARVSEPDEIASIGVFLASNLSAAINGQSILADSGKMGAAFGEATLGPIQPMPPL